MKKSLFSLLGLLAISAVVVACNSGGSGPEATKYITSGKYQTIIIDSNGSGVLKKQCVDSLGSESGNTLIGSNGISCDMDGKNCDKSAANLLKNPCLSYTDKESEITATLTLSGCSQNTSNVFKATKVIEVSGEGITGKCTQTVVLKPVAN